MRRARAWLVAGVVAHLLAGLWLAGGLGGADGFEPTALRLVLGPGAPAILALLASLLGRRGPVIVLAAVGLGLAALLVPVYLLGLLLLPGAILTAVGAAYVPQNVR